MRPTRFFYHFNKSTKKLSIHFKNACTPIDNIICKVETESHWNKTQPMLVIRGFAKEILLEETVAGVTAIII